MKKRRYAAEGLYYTTYARLKEIGACARGLELWREAFGTGKVVITHEVVKIIDRWPVDALSFLEIRQRDEDKLTANEYFNGAGWKPTGFWKQLKQRAKREGRLP